MQISYEEYLDKVLGGWLGKCIGGTIGARFEGKKEWIELEPKDFFPEVIPPNDDLDLQILWLKVLEEKGAKLNSVDLAEAWIEGCWYPFNEYGVFRRNWRVGIHPPLSGTYANPFWKTGMGCPIRSEIWGYVCPGRPEEAARLAYLDGTLDHGMQSTGAEMMFSAVAAEAFFNHDLQYLLEKHFHYLPEGTPIYNLTRMAIEGYNRGQDLRELWDNIIANAPCGEACDSQINVPFTVAGLLYGEGDMTETLRLTLALGYDTDCTLATAVAFLGQVAGAAAISEELKKPIGDELVMGIEYRREEMTVSALARDTARIGVLISEDSVGIEINGAPELEPLPKIEEEQLEFAASYDPLPAAAPGDTVKVTVTATGNIKENVGFELSVPEDWQAVPKAGAFSPTCKAVTFSLHLPRDVKEIRQINMFTLKTAQQEFSFGVRGAECWKLLGVFYETVSPVPLIKEQGGRRMASYFVDTEKEYLPITEDGDAAFREWSRKCGRAAVLPVRELMLDFASVIPLDTAWCVYFERKITVKEDCELVFFTGHDTPYKAWVNGQELFESTEHTMWHPQSNTPVGKLNKGENTIRIKVTRSGPCPRFSLELRSCGENKSLQLTNGDPLFDYSEENPYIKL